MSGGDPAEISLGFIERARAGPLSTKVDEKPPALTDQQQTVRENDQSRSYVAPCTFVTMDSPVRCNNLECEMSETCFACGVEASSEIKVNGESRLVCAACSSPDAIARLPY